MVHLGGVPSGQMRLACIVRAVQNIEICLPTDIKRRFLRYAAFGNTGKGVCTQQVLSRKYAESRKCIAVVFAGFWWDADSLFVAY